MNRVEVESASSREHSGVQQSTAGTFWHSSLSARATLTMLVYKHDTYSCWTINNLSQKKFDTKIRQRCEGEVHIIYIYIKIAFYFLAFCTFALGFCLILVHCICCLNATLNNINNKFAVCMVSPLDKCYIGEVMRFAWCMVLLHKTVPCVTGYFPLTVCSQWIANLSCVVTLAELFNEYVPQPESGGKQAGSVSNTSTCKVFRISVLQYSVTAGLKNCIHKECVK